MNRRSVLTLLEKEPGDESVQIAVEWIKKQKPESPRVGLVIQKLLEVPALDSHLAWLCNYSRLGRLDFLEKMTLGDRSLQTYDRIIKLLSANLEHSQCGQILGQMLIRNQLILSD